MRPILVGVVVCIAIAAMAQDRVDAAGSGSQARDFSSLEPFGRGMTLANREVTAYIIRAATLPNHRYPKPVVIIWTKEAVVAEQKGGEAPTTRTVSPGQINVYPGGTNHSLRAVKGSLHFTLIELEQSLRDPKDLPTKPADCENIADFPEGGFACLIRIAPDKQITIPKLGVNSFFIAVSPGRVRNIIPRSRHWETRYRAGQVSYHPGYELARRNLEKGPLEFVLIVPPPAEYN